MDDKNSLGPGSRAPPDRAIASVPHPLLRPETPGAR